MMRVLPKSASEWVAFALLPFKAYTVLAVICLFIRGAGLPPHSGGGDAAAIVVLGYFLCALVLILAAVIQVFTGPRGAALSSIGIGAAAFVIGWWLLPLLAT